MQDCGISTPNSVNSMLNLTALTFCLLCQDVCGTISLADVCCTEHLSSQRHLLATISAVVDKAGEESSVHSFKLFYVLLHVKALQREGSLELEVHFTCFINILKKLTKSYFSHLNFIVHKK